LPDEQRLFLWKPEKVGKYLIIVRPFKLKLGAYRFEAKVSYHCDIDGQIGTFAHFRVGSESFAHSMQDVFSWIKVMRSSRSGVRISKKSGSHLKKAKA